MTITEIKKAIESGKIKFGAKEVLKHGADKVFLAGDARQEIEDKIKEKGIEVIRLKEDKEKIAKELKLEFLSEVFAIGKKREKKEEAKDKPIKSRKKKSDKE